MLQIKVNDKQFSVATDGGGNQKVFVDGKWLNCDIEEISEGRFLLRQGTKVYELFLLSSVEGGKELEVQIGQNYYKVEIQNEFDQLLGTMGFQSGNSKKLKELKSPMPGKIISVLVEEGAEIKAGEPLLILEAMKMENLLQSAVDGKIEKILVAKDSSVNKNDLLIKFV